MGGGLTTSDPSLTCPAFAALGPEMLRTPENDARTIAQGQAALRACHDRFIRDGVELDHYTVIDEADDVVDLARTLHVDQLNLQARVGRGTRRAGRRAARRPTSCARCSCSTPRCHGPAS